MKIYGFAFSLHNISTRTLYALNGLDNKYLIFPKNIAKYMEVLKRENPDYILGVGIYSRKSDYLHLETKCSNLFRGKYINNESSHIEEYILPFLKETNDIKYTQTIAHNMCNLMSYKIMSMITDGEITSKFNFIHIPKNFNGDVAETLNQAIEKDVISSYT